MRTRQRGAALPLGIALLLCGTIGGFVLYNTGQSATDKARVVNAADAASYSGLVWQARALNFQAYTNRAMVANQVSMAQAVSLRSWATYGASTAQNVELVLGKIPYIGPIFVGGARVMEGVNRIVGPVANAMLVAVNAVNVGIRHAQNAMFVSSFAATPEIIRAVVESSDPRFTADTAFSVAGVLGNLHAWKNFTVEVGRDDTEAMLERAAIISGDPNGKTDEARRGQRDDFTAGRNWSILPFDLPITPVMTVNVDREGDTRLVHRTNAKGELEFEWKAKDTVALDLGRWSWSRFKFKHKDVPIGWAQAYANSARKPAARRRTIEKGACTDPKDFKRILGAGKDCTQWFSKNRNAERFADTGLRFGREESRIAMNGYSGLNPFRDLSPKTVEAGFPTMRLKVEVALDAEAVRSSEAMGTTGRLRTGYRSPGAVLSSVSVAELFFKPPQADRDGGRIEFANAYNPWWDVRLAPISETDRMGAFVLRDHRDTRIGGARAPGAGAGGGAGGLAAWDGTVGDAPNGRSIREAIAGFGELAAMTGAAEQAAGAIEKTLVSAVETAVEGLVDGLIGGGVGANPADALGAWAEARTGVEVDAARAATGAAIDVAEGVREEAERVRAMLEPELRDTVTRRIEDEFGAERHLLDALGDPDAPEEAKAAARDRLDEIEDRLVRDLGRELSERVEAATDVLELSERQARHQVRLLIKSLREELSETPDFLPFAEDSISDAGTGPDPDAAEGEPGTGDAAPEGDAS